MRRILRSGSVAVAAIGLLLAMSLPAAGAQAGTARPAAGPFPERALPAAPAASSGFHILYGVFCASRTDCWAVGQRADGDALVNQMMHWNGKSWQQSPTPNPGGTGKFDDNELFAVRCLATRDCWAVGEYLKGHSWLAEALHWTGKKWYSTKVPAYGGTGTNDVTELFDSTCTAANSCWAVGDFGIGNAPPVKQLNLTLHWNGKKWSKVRTPNPAGVKMKDVNFLDAVRCVSATDCDAAGGYGTVSTTADKTLNEVLHWNGKSWSWVHVANPGGTGAQEDNQLVALACGGARSCWGAGYYDKYEPAQTFQNEMFHWNGKKWATVKVPEPGGTKSGDSNFTYGATCDGSASCWAVGDYRNKNNATVNEALHWNGKRWYLVGMPNPGGSKALDQSYLYGIRCTSSANCWAVGGALPYLAPSVSNEILHWNGKHWSIWT
jgi:hypothetical protein